MIKKFHIAVLFLALGLFLAPGLSYACGSSTAQTEKSCCDKNKTVNPDARDCCQNHSSNKNHQDCDGSCQDSSCQCSNFCFNPALPSAPVLKNKIFYAHNEKQNFSSLNTCLSPGFLSVWLLPKIN